MKLGLGYVIIKYLFAKINIWKRPSAEGLRHTHTRYEPLGDKQLSLGLH